MFITLCSESDLEMVAVYGRICAPFIRESVPFYLGIMSLGTSRASWRQLLRYQRTTLAKAKVKRNAL